MTLGRRHGRWHAAGFLRMVAGIAVLAAAASAQTWDATNDFSLTSNPNGAWTYGWEQTIGGPFHVFASNGGCSTVQSWTTGDPLSLGKNTSSSPACCATWSLPGQTLYCHPGGGGERATWRWTAPYAAVFTVSAQFGGGDHSYPTTTDAAVDVNGTLVFSQYVNSYTAGTPCSSNSYTPSATYQGNLVLGAGDHVDVSVGFGSNGNYDGDLTIVAIVINGPYSATATPVGTGCGGGASPPVLTCSPPVIGQNVMLGITNGTPFTGGAIFSSGPPAAPTPVGAGCTVYLDLATYLPLIQPIATNAAGAWSLSVGVPNDNGLIGLTVILQGALFPTVGPLGIDLTNGVIVMAGL